MKKVSKFFLLTFPLFLLLIILSAGCEEPIVGPITPCGDLTSQPIPQQYIIYFDDPIDGNGFINPKIPELIDELKETGDSVLSTCMCGMYLMGVPDGVDLKERVRGARNKTKSVGDLDAFIDLNFPVLFDPISGTPPSINASIGAIDDRVFEYDKRVSVAILDTGFDPNAGGNTTGIGQHRWKNLSPDEDENCIDGDVNGADVHQGIGIDEGYFINDAHGTAVAGMVAGLPDNGYPEDIDLELLNIRFTYTDIDGRDKGNLFDAICGMQYAIDMDADVIVNSWGLYQDTLNHSLKGVLLAAKESNVTIIAAAGNESTDIDECSFYPASIASEPFFNNVISVAAFGSSSDVLADFSNYGKNSVLVSAPGENINVIIPDEMTAKMNGTSISAPYVARVVSMIKALDPDIEAEALRQCLYEYIVDNDSSIKEGALAELVEVVDACD